MKHNGIIPSDEADKLYSYPILSGDSDTFLNGAGDFDHPHVEYFPPDGAQSIQTNNAFQPGQYCSFVKLSVDKYGHVIALGTRRVTHGHTNATTTTAGLMSAADKIKFDEMYEWYSAQKEG